MNPLDIQVPEQSDLEAELRLIRHKGITSLGKLDLPALKQAARAWGRVEQDDVASSVVIERMLRDAAARMGEHDHGDCARTSLGLNPEDRSVSPSDLRKAAASYLHISTDHYRKSKEPMIISEVAHHILAEIHDYRLRIAALRMEVRTPVSSRLAIEWLSRFEAMYRIWVEVSGIGNDLTAARSTMLEEDRPWDLAPDPDKPGDLGYTQEDQAESYADFSFFHYAEYLAALRKFEQNFGGMWILPELQAQEDIVDANERIRVNSPSNELEDSILRTLLTKADGEMAAFDQLVKDDATASAHQKDWLAFVASCKCVWNLDERKGRELFPTPINNPGIDPNCDVHMLVTACGDFLLTLDDSWEQIADWYHHIPRPNPIDVTPEQLYQAREHPKMRWER